MKKALTVCTGTPKKPTHPSSSLDLKETEKAILFIKRHFQDALAHELNLMRITAPLFVKTGTGINDDLNGIERPVTFSIKDDGESTAVVVHSLAKWKRIALAKYSMKPGEGLYTDMNAIRADEKLDAIHSLYVDQWDWERVVRPEDRKKLAYHRMVLSNELPLSIGGGIGQSRLCMYFLRKTHIGQVQASLWPDAMAKKCTENGIILL